MLDKKEVQKIIETTVMTYKCGLDEINEIYFDEAKRCKKDKVKLAELSRKSFEEEMKNEKSAIEYGIKEICQLQSKNQKVIAEGKIRYDGAGWKIGDKYIRSLDIICNPGIYENWTKVKLILEVEDDK